MELKAVAYHEAGHAVVGVLMGVYFDAVTIIPNVAEETGGFVNFLDDDVAEEDALIILYAGPAAEAKFRKCSFLNTHSISDLKRARLIFETWIQPERKTDGSDDPRLSQLYYVTNKQAKLVVNSVWDKIEAVSDALIERKTLTYDEVAKLCEVS